MVFLVLLGPLLVILFALFMERIEHRLRTGSVSEEDVEEFFEQAGPDEVDTFINEGWTRALSRLRLRRRRGTHSRSRRSSRRHSRRRAHQQKPSPEANTRATS